MREVATEYAGGARTSALSNDVLQGLCLRLCGWRRPDGEPGGDVEHQPSLDMPPPIMRRAGTFKTAVDDAGCGQRLNRR